MAVEWIWRCLAKLGGSIDFWKFLREFVDLLYFLQSRKRNGCSVCPWIWRGEADKLGLHAHYVGFCLLIISLLQLALNGAAEPFSQMSFCTHRIQQK